MKENMKNTPIIESEEQESLLPDFTDIQEVKKAFIATEIFNRKYIKEHSMDDIDSEIASKELELELMKKEYLK